MSLVLTDENFEKEISRMGKPVLVDFWLEGCGPCQLIGPILEKVTQELKEEIIFAKVNFREAPLVLAKLGINAAPTVILFKDGQPISGFVGFRPLAEIRNWLNDLLK
ncbi:MAG: thioredoxin family protein [Minisyncoccales bacterium]